MIIVWGGGCMCGSRLPEPQRSESGKKQQVGHSVLSHTQRVNKSFPLASDFRPHVMETKGLSLEASISLSAGAPHFLRVVSSLDTSRQSSSEDVTGRGADTCWTRDRHHRTAPRLTIRLVWLQGALKQQRKRRCSGRVALTCWWQASRKWDRVNFPWRCLQDRHRFIKKVFLLAAMTSEFLSAGGSWAANTRGWGGGTEESEP